MINIISKKDCCGCSACHQLCPKGCISMFEDSEGFIYPKVNLDACVDCHICEKICPVINQSPTRAPIQVYAAYNLNDTILEHSSSGGVFTALSESIIQEGGVVYGAAFSEDWGVKHIRVETLADLSLLRGSKYVQSIIGNCYREAEKDLKEDKLVLFSGTPCQIAGLKKYLRKEYDNLYCVEIICHGTPSPLVWRAYLKTIPLKLNSRKGCSIHIKKKNLPQITEINFRDKTNGWLNYSFSVKGSHKSVSQCDSVINLIDSSSDNIYLRGFIHNLYLRPSCYHCSSRKGKSGADLQLGDFWGVKRRNPSFYNPLGVNLVIIYSEKGYNLFNQIESHLTYTTASYDDVLDCNINVENDEIEPTTRDAFFDSFRQHGIKVVKYYCDKIDNRNMMWYFKRLISKLMHYTNK